MMKKSLFFCLLSLNLAQVGLAQLGLVACNEGMGSKDFQLKPIALTVTGSMSLNDSVPEGRIDFYRITLTAPDLVVPILKEVRDTSSRLSLDGIPTGKDRRLAIEALNPFGQVIRRGVKEGISIEAGSYSSIHLVMRTVPILINLRPDAVVHSRRLLFKTLAEPGHGLILGLKSDDEDCEPILNQLTQTYAIDTSAPDGLFQHDPEPLADGRYCFCLRDQETGEISELTATVMQDTVRPGLSLTPLGHLREAAQSSESDAPSSWAHSSFYYQNGGELGDILDSLYTEEL